MYFPKIEIRNISNSWKEIRFEETGHIQYLLNNYFAEILYNACKYADFQNGFVSIDFNNFVIKETEHYEICFTNKIKSRKKIHSTQVGLDGIYSELEYINDFSKEEYPYLEKEELDGYFTVKLRLDQHLLVPVQLF